jgi:hypothetical protein
VITELQIVVIVVLWKYFCIKNQVYFWDCMRLKCSCSLTRGKDEAKIDVSYSDFRLTCCMFK